MGINYLEGRNDNTLWLMFKAANITKEFSNSDGDLIVCSRFENGNNTVYFKENISDHIVEVNQPGVCLFTKYFKTNTFLTKWERI